MKLDGAVAGINKEDSKYLSSSLLTPILLHWVIVLTSSLILLKGQVVLYTEIYEIIIILESRYGKIRLKVNFCTLSRENFNSVMLTFDLFSK